MDDLKGRLALVTGGAKGIGRAIVEVLAKHGAKVVIADVNLDLAKETANELDNDDVVAVKMDVSDPDGIESVMDQIFETYGSLDILVNNAGIVNNSKIDEATMEQWDRVMAINLRGVHLCSKHAFFQMKEKGGGSIINMASMGGQQGGIKSGIDYTASKAALFGLSKTYARQGAAHGIRCNCVSPGFIETDMTRGNYDPNTVPLLRLGVPEDVANAVYFLASDLSSYITGTTIDVNGGVLMR